MQSIKEDIGFGPVLKLGVDFSSEVLWF